MNANIMILPFFDKVYNYICDTKLPAESVTHIRHLGKRLEKDSKRPLLITVNSESIKKQFFSKLYKLKDEHEFKNISVSHDMTEERLNTKLLVEKARKRNRELAGNNDENISKNWVFKVRGPPWEQRIVKVMIRPQH